MADELTAAQRETQRHPVELGAADSQRLKAVEEALAALRRSARDLSFYPSGHPTLEKSLERVTAQLRQLVELEDPLSITIAREGLTHRLGEIGKANPTIKSFGAELFLSQLRHIHFGRNFAPDELRAFLGLVGMDPKKILLQGGPEAILAAASVRNIQVNALRFKPVGEEAAERGGAGLGAGGDDLAEAVAPAQGEELQEGPTQSADVTSEAGDLLGGSAQKVHLLMQAGNAPVVIEEENLTLDEILARLEVAEGMDYRRLARRLDLVARNAMMHGDVEQFLRIAGVLTRHRDDPARPDDIRLAATQWLEGMVEGGGADFLVDRLCQKEPAHGEEILGILGALGEAAVDALLQRLTIEESMSARRRLLAAIVRHGDLALPQILRGLQDDRWFVVRNMATLLGELGHDSALEPLAQQAHHPDRRVRREVARAVAKIGGRHAPRFLRDCLADEDPGVRQAAVIFLGANRDHLSLQRLMAIAEARTRDGEEHELRKAAIQALGQMGNRRAVPTLARLIRKGSWLRRAELDEIRLAATAALGLLGGPEAVAALERGRGGGGRVGEACREALTRLGS
ncbi:MAG TPA: HEAT repeat domain-containing protein [Candidatus Methylomirabilis sp.]|jgi:HEAT repeat protein